MPKTYTRKVDKKMKNYGDIDDKKKVIRINPRHGDLLNTILHEEAHKKHPKMLEKNITKLTKREEKKLTIPKAINLLKKFK